MRSFLILFPLWVLLGFLSIHLYVGFWSYRDSRREGFRPVRSLGIAWAVSRTSCGNVHGLTLSAWGPLAPGWLWWTWRTRQDEPTETCKACGETLPAGGGLWVDDPAEDIGPLCGQCHADLLAAAQAEVESEQRTGHLSL